MPGKAGLLCACGRWQEGKSADEIIRQRNEATDRIVNMGRVMRESGRCDQWFDGAEPGVRHIARDVNGPLCEAVVAECGYEDQAVAEVFRKGGPLYGDMTECGIGTAVDEDSSARDVEDLRKDVWGSNKLLAKELRKDAFEEEFHQLVLKDAAQGWMSEPAKASEAFLQARAVPGVGVQQGLKKDGSVKVRAVYNFSWSTPWPVDAVKRIPYKEAKARSVNGCTWLPEKLSHDHLDDLIWYCRQLVLLLGIVPALFKADIASAFRRIPLMPEHMWAAGIMYWYKGSIWTSVHKSCPFGAKASVFNWERVGRFLRTVARRLLHIGMFEYVDDYFAAEHPSVVEHAMECFAKVVRALLGDGAIAEGKLLWGSSLEILGVQVNLAWDRFTLRPSIEKMRKCLVVIKAALAEGGSLSPGCASKLAGRLQWACQYMFHRLGRAMMQPIYAQCHAWNGFVDNDLKVALAWWCQVLMLDIVEERFWTQSEAPLAHLFVDAAGKSSRLAVLLGRMVFLECVLCEGALL